MIDEKLEEELARFENNFIKYSQRNPDQYQFGEAVGTHLLESELLSPEQRLEKNTLQTSKNQVEQVAPIRKVKAIKKGSQ